MDKKWIYLNGRNNLTNIQTIIYNKILKELIIIKTHNKPILTEKLQNFKLIIN